MSAGAWGDGGVEEPRTANHRRITSVGLHVSAPLLPFGDRYIDLLTLSGATPSQPVLPASLHHPEPLRPLQANHNSRWRTAGVEELLHTEVSPPSRIRFAAGRVVFNALYIFDSISFCVKIAKDIRLPLGLFFHSCQACTPADCLSGSPECHSCCWYSDG